MTKLALFSTWSINICCLVPQVKWFVAACRSHFFPLELPCETHNPESFSAALEQAGKQLYSGGSARETDKVALGLTLWPRCLCLVIDRWVVWFHKMYGIHHHQQVRVALNCKCDYFTFLCVYLLFGPVSSNWSVSKDSSWTTFNKR